MCADYDCALGATLSGAMLARVTTTHDDPVLESVRFPIGRFEAQDSYSTNDVKELLQRFELAPKRLAVVVRGLTPAQLYTVYRAGGWTARQVVHHLADSALNGYARFRWALTEDEPAIKPYDENAWSALPDAVRGPLAPSAGAAGRNSAGRGPAWGAGSGVRPVPSESVEPSASGFIAAGNLALVKFFASEIGPASRTHAEQKASPQVAHRP